MPYIELTRRPALDDHIDDLLLDIRNAGELNYTLSRLIDGYARLTTGLRYSTIAEVTGVLENVKQEWYRRVVVPYEDLKLVQTGDVYGGPK